MDKLLGPTAFFAGSLIGVLRTIKAIVDQSGLLERGLARIASLQQISGKFETLLKSAEKAQQRLKELYKFTASSPFDFQDVAEANRLLESLTKGALSGSRGMKLVGDAAAATGESMTATAERVGKLYHALESGRSLDRIMFQLQATGAVNDELARKLENAEQAGASFADKWKLVEDQLRATDGGMANEIKSLDALSKRLATASAGMEQAFAAPFVDAQAKAIENTIKATENLTPVLGKIGQDIAPILNLFRTVKNEITVATIATRGFADALSVAWDVAKSLGMAVAGATLASLAGNFLKIAGAARTFGVNLATSRRAIVESAQAVGALTKSQTLAQQASGAFADGSIVTAAALGAQALWTRASAAALNLHKTAMATATASGARFNVATYAAAIAGQILAGGLKVIASGFTTATRGAIAFAAANPLIAIGTAALVAGAAFKTWADNVAKANREYVDFVLNLSKSRDEMRKLVADVKNLDQYRSAIIKNDNEQTRIKEEIANMGSRPAAGKTYELGADYKVRERTALNPAGEEYDNRKAELERTLAALRKSRGDLESKLPTLGIGKEERQQIFDLTTKRLALRDTTEQEQINRTGDLRRRGLLLARVRRLNSEADTGEEIAAARTAPERFKNKPTELMRVSEQIANLEKAGQAVPAKLYERQAELNQFADTFMEKRAQALQDVTQARELGFSVRSSVGGVAAGRMRNQALIKRDRDVATAAENLQARDDLREQYRKIGLTRNQADADFSLKLRGDAMARGPQISADSLQRLGGGGGSYGSDPDAAARRQVEIMGRVESILQRIEQHTADAARGGLIGN